LVFKFSQILIFYIVFMGEIKNFPIRFAPSDGSGSDGHNRDNVDKMYVPGDKVTWTLRILNRTRPPHPRVEDKIIDDYTNAHVIKTLNNATEAVVLDNPVLYRKLIDRAQDLGLVK